jgi:hypothetical protein
MTLDWRDPQGRTPICDNQIPMIASAWSDGKQAPLRVGSLHASARRGTPNAHFQFVTFDVFSICAPAEGGR